MICSCHFCQKLCVRTAGHFGADRLNCKDCGITYEMSYTTLHKMIFHCALDQKEYSIDLIMSTRKMEIKTPTGRLYFDFLPADLTPRNVAKKLKTFLVFS